MCAEPATVIHVGPKSVVRSGPRPGLVTKLYRELDSRSGRVAAEVEFDRGRRFHAALIDLPGVSSARPVDIVREGSGWGLILEEVNGVSLLSFLTASDRPRPEALAGLLAAGVRAYCQALGEPYYGLKPQDVLYDASRGEIVLLDFEPADSEVWARDPAEDAPVAASVGLLLGRTLHYLTAPSRLRRVAGRRWLLDLIGAAAVAAGSSVDGFTSRDLNAIDTLVRRTYARMGSSLWYRKMETGRSYAGTSKTRMPLQLWRPVWYGLRPVWYRLLWMAVGRGELRRLLGAVDAKPGSPVASP